MPQDVAEATRLAANAGQVGGVDASRWAEVVSRLQEQVVELRAKLRTSKTQESELQEQLRDLSNKCVAAPRCPHTHAWLLLWWSSHRPAPSRHTGTVTPLPPHTAGTR